MQIFRIVNYMDFEFLILGGYGQFVWPSFIFTILTCLFLYLKTKKEMQKQEKEHLIYFEKEIQKRKIKPTYLLPLWDLMGVTLGFSSVLLGKKAAMLCTASVEEVIDGHYKSQLKFLGSDEKDLRKKIEKFKQDELNHRNIAYESGTTTKGLYSILNKVIKTGSKIAITISEKI